MTPDDTQIPQGDGAARAARLGLRQLAGSDAPGDLSWDAVQAGARRVQRRRLTAVGVACAVVVLGAGAAVAAVGRNDDHLDVAGARSPTTTTTTPTSTSMSAPSTTTSTPETPGSAGATTTIPAPPVQYALPGDLQGTLKLASTTMVAEQSTAFTLTLRNITDHAIYVPAYPALGVWIDAVSSGDFSAPGVGEYDFTLAPNEERTFTHAVTPVAEMVGPARVWAAIITGTNPPDGNCCNTPHYITGVAPVSVTILPPGWVEGQPLDPSQGQWTSTMSADATSVRAGNAVSVNATLRNTGDQPQTTQGYGSLAISCRGSAEPYWVHGEFVDPATLAPGAEQTFTIEFRPPDAFTGDAVCSVGIAFHGDANFAGPRAGIESDSVAITVLPALEPTTTTAPDAATSTTTP